MWKKGDKVRCIIDSQYYGGPAKGEICVIEHPVDAHHYKLEGYELVSAFPDTHLVHHEKVLTPEQPTINGYLVDPGLFHRTYCMLTNYKEETHSRTTHKDLEEILADLSKIKEQY